MEKKKMNSYVKMIIVMAIGGLIGALIGFGSFFMEGDLKNSLSIASLALMENAHIILWCLTVTALIVCILSYLKSGSILKQSLADDDDETQDLLDKEYDFWSTLGVTASNIFFGISLVVFAFSSSDIAAIELSKISQSIIAFLLCMIICIVYQIAIVKQMKKKDPAKYDDAMNFKFQEKFLETCDEGERQIIYKSAYKTFQLMQQIIIFTLCFAVLGHMLLGTGITAVVLIGGLHITMTTAYSIYTMKLQNAK